MLPRPTLAALAVLLLPLLPRPAAAQTVAAERGNVVYTAPGAPPRTLTRTGRDADPALSPDRRTVVFVRATGRTVEGPAMPVGESELWAVEVASGRQRRLLGSRPHAAPERALVSFQKPRVSPDGRTVYFLASAWATSGAVHALDPGTGRTRYVAPGNDLEVVPSGRYAGHLLIHQHRYFVGGGSFDWYWLFTPGGREVGPVGETVDTFMATYVER